MPAPHAIGWYGKLPGRGDFVVRGLPRAWWRAWDDWLQRAMARGQAHWGDAFRGRLLLLPPWHAIVPAQAAGMPAWCVVVVASRDRVGRAFPLLLAEAHEPAALDDAPLAAWHARALAWTQWLGSLGDGHSPHDMEQGVATIGAQPWGEAAEGAARFGALRARWPAAGSFWWPTAPDASEWAPRVQPWPPRDALLMDWLGEDDTAPPEDAG